MEEKILDSHLEFKLQDILNISKKEVHDVKNDLMKRTRHSTKREEMGPMDVYTSVITSKGFEFHEEYVDNHYNRLH